MAHADSVILFVFDSVKLLPDDIKLKARTLQLMYETTSFYAPASKPLHAIPTTLDVPHSLNRNKQAQQATAVTQVRQARQSNMRWCKA